MDPHIIQSGTYFTANMHGMSPPTKRLFIVGKGGWFLEEHRTAEYRAP